MPTPLEDGRPPLSAEAQAFMQSIAARIFGGLTPRQVAEIYRAEDATYPELELYQEAQRLEAMGDVWAPGAPPFSARRELQA